MLSCQTSQQPIRQPHAQLSLGLHKDQDARDEVDQNSARNGAPFTFAKPSSFEPQSSQMSPQRALTSHNQLRLFKMGPAAVKDKFHEDEEKEEHLLAAGGSRKDLDLTKAEDCASKRKSSWSNLRRAGEREPMEDFEDFCDFSDEELKAQLTVDRHRTFSSLCEKDGKDLHDYLRKEAAVGNDSLSKVNSETRF